MSVVCLGCPNMCRLESSNFQKRRSLHNKPFFKKKKKQQYPVLEVTVRREEARVKSMSEYYIELSEAYKFGKEKVPEVEGGS